MEPSNPELLPTKKISYKQMDPEKELRICASLGNVERMAELVLSPGININQSAVESSLNALHRACEFQQKVAVALLLKHQAEVNAQTKGGNSALHFAIFPRVEKLKSTETKEKDEWTSTEIQIKLEIVTMLLKHGANPILENKVHITPFMLLSHIRDSPTLALTKPSHRQISNQLREVTRACKTYVAEQARQRDKHVQLLSSGEVVFSDALEGLPIKDPNASLISVTPFSTSSSKPILLAPHW